MTPEQLESILPELRQFQAHAAEMERWAGKIIAKIEK